MEPKKDHIPSQDDEMSQEITDNQSIDQNPERDVETEIAEIKDQLLRALAETENVRRRAAQDKEDALKYGVTSFARDMVVIADNLRRALDHIDPETLPETLKSMVEGVEITEKEMENLFQKHGLTKVNPMGEKFDSHLHQAMFEKESDDQAPGTVVEVMQVGYTLHGRLLRPAMVGVAKKS